MPPRTRPRAPKKQLVTRAELARLKGISRAAVTSACREGGPLEGAVHGSRVDAADPAVATWLAEPQRGPDSTAVAAPSSHQAAMQALARQKRSEEVAKLSLANAKERGQLISRQLVETHIFGSLEFLHKRLLGDAAKSIAARCCSLVRSGAPLEEVQRMVRDEISKQLRLSKEKVARVLNGRTRPAAATKRARKAAKK